MAGTGFIIGLDGHNMRPLTEAQAMEIADGLRVIYERARENMLEITARRAAAGIAKPGWAERKAAEILAAHAEVERHYAYAQEERRGILQDVPGRAALTGSEKFYRDMQDVVGGAVHIHPNAEKVAAILADLNNSLDAAERRILRQFDDAYSHIIGSASAELATGTITGRQAIQKALTQFADEGIDGFIDRAGRHWQMDTYAQMATLTAINRASVSGYTDTMQSYGYDLAFIDGHAGSCPVCQAWEGVIVSVSGNNTDYPSLSDAEDDGVFHPNCIHLIATYYEGISHAPEGGFRSSPRDIEPPNEEYTARSRQRYMERQIRKYKDRMRVSVTQQAERQAYSMVKGWQAKLREHLAENASLPLLRDYGREGGSVKLLLQ